MLPPDEDAELWKEGLVTFGSFVVFGSVRTLALLRHCQDMQDRAKSEAGSEATNARFLSSLP